MSAGKYVIKYRTHAPWQSEAIEGDRSQTMIKAQAIHRAWELSKSYRHVVLDYHEEIAHYRDGEYLSGPDRSE